MGDGKFKKKQQHLQLHSICFGLKKMVKGILFSVLALFREVYTVTWYWSGQGFPAINL